MDSEKLFLERCKQIEKLMESDAEIDLLDLSAKLRQLFLDDDPLIHQVNRNFKIKLSFSVGTFRNEPDEFTQIAALEDGLDPDTRPPGSPSKVVNFDGFIGHKALFLKGSAHSVRDIIKHASDAAGGVHRTDPPKEQQKKIAEYSAGFGIGGLPAGIRQLKGIGRVSLKGLKPLIEAIEKSQKSKHDSEKL